MWKLYRGQVWFTGLQYLQSGSHTSSFRFCINWLIIRKIKSWPTNSWLRWWGMLHLTVPATSIKTGGFFCRDMTWCLPSHEGLSAKTWGFVCQDVRGCLPRLEGLSSKMWGVVCQDVRGCLSRQEGCLPRREGLSSKTRGVVCQDVRGFLPIREELSTMA